MDAEEDRAIGFTRFGLLLSCGVAILMAMDLVADRGLGAGAAHVALQLAVFLVALGGALVMLRQLYAARARLRELDRALDTARDDLRRWRDEAQAHVRGLGDAIDRQFDRWTFTDAERQVALLLLKGHSHREIASERKTGEQTVRQQSLALYRKAGLAGRAELAAFFLEELFAPR